ncbi:MAG: PspC domain-containing protein [Acidobacteria bacterium]|nr:PspC domain-containing protein [Acidobacteriota bacterium]
MFCTRCGNAMKDADKFCSGCGATVAAGPAGAGASGSGPAGGMGGPKRLARMMNDKKIAGVCSGVARYFGIDTTLVRIVWLLLILCAGTGVLAYIICWIAMPKDYGTPGQPAYV